MKTRTCCARSVWDWLAAGLAWLALAAGVTAAEVVEPQMLPVGAPWRFYVVADDSPPPAAGWLEREFDDSAWSNGLSGFSTYTAEPSIEATYLGRTTMRSACFRGGFSLADPSAVQWLVLRVDYVSGFVAWLNGREIARRGVAGEPPAFDAIASGHARQATEELDVSAHRDALVAGTNVLAIHLFGSAQPAYGLVLVPELRANFTRGPYLQNVGKETASILWRTPLPATTVVEYGATPALGQSVEDPTPATNHVVTLTGLAPDTECYYRVRSRAGAQEAVSPISRFRTLRTSGDLAFAVFGDSGSGWMSQLQVASCLSTAAVDLVLHTGDITYPTLNRGIVDTRCLSVYANQMRHTPFFFTPGNHDLYAPDTLATYLETFLLPTNPVTGTTHFYSFDHGDAHFVSLFVPTLTPFAGTDPYVLRPGSPQMQWLTNDLAATTRPWRILLLHMPLFDSTGHQTDDLNDNGVADRLELREWLLPVAKRFGVQAIFSGHAHCFERFAPVEGVHCIVTGGGGYTLYGLVQREPLSQRFEPRFHHLAARISGDALQVQAVDRYGAVFDSFTIPRVSPPTLGAALVGPQTLRLRWNAAPHVRYQVEAAATAGGPFSTLDHPALPLTADDYQAQLDLDLGGTGAAPGAAFFRVRVLVPAP